MSELDDFVGRYIELHPDAAAVAIETDKRQPSLAYLAGLSDEELTSLIPHLSPHIASLMLEQTSSQRAGPILNKVPDAICAKVLRHIGRDKRESIVAGMNTARAKRIELLLSFGPGTAASIMDNTVPAIASTETVGGCMALLKRSKHKSIYYLYFVDSDYRLCGVMNLKELLNASESPQDPLKSYWNKDVVSIRADLSVESLLLHPAWLNYHSLPVSDQNGRYLGVIRYEAIKLLEVQ